MTLESLLEGILFLNPEGVSVADLATKSGATAYEVASALRNLEASLASRGIHLVIHTEKAVLVAAQEVVEIVQASREEELHGDLGQGSLEVLAIVVYHAPVSQAQIDYLRGVRSHGISKNLLMRGLIEKKVDQDRTVFVPTLDLYLALGIKDRKELPDLADIQARSEKIFVL